SASVDTRKLLLHSRHAPQNLSVNHLTVGLCTCDNRAISHSLLHRGLPLLVLTHTNRNLVLASVGCGNLILLRLCLPITNSIRRREATGEAANNRQFGCSRLAGLFSTIPRAHARDVKLCSVAHLAWRRAAPPV